MFVVELVEGKAHPCQTGPLEFYNLDGKTVVLLLSMIKICFSTGRYVILDSGFCLFKCFIELRKKGVFSCAVMNNRRYWHSMVPGKEMEDHLWGV